MGVAATAVRQGRDRIYVHAPTLQETPALKDLLTKSARPGFHDEPVIAFRFTGARAFARYTAENVGRPFAVVLDDVVLSSPVIREPILGGSGQVSGRRLSSWRCSCAQVRYPQSLQWRRSGWFLPAANGHDTP